MRLIYMNIDCMSMGLQYEGLVGDNEQHLYTYHVVYNESYRVPMLFLQGRLPGLCLESVIDRVLILYLLHVRCNFKICSCEVLELRA